MKKLVSVLLATVMMLTLFAVPVSASANTPEKIQYIEYIDEDSYFLVEIETTSSPLTRATTSGNKSSTYVYGGKSIWTVTVYGSFTYNGSTSSATSASGNVTTHVTGCSIGSRNSYYSGSTAYATASVTYNGSSVSRTVSLYCDKNGKLS